MKLIPLSPPQQKQVLPYLSTRLHQKWGGVQKLWFVSVPLVHVEYSIAFVSSVLVWY